MLFFFFVGFFWNLSLFLKIVGFNFNFMVLYVEKLLGYLDLFDEFGFNLVLYKYYLYVKFFCCNGKLLFF